MAALREGEATASLGREENEPGAAVPAGPSYLDGMGGACFWPRRGGGGASQPGKVGGGRSADKGRDFGAKKTPNQLAASRREAGRLRLQIGD